MFGFLQRRGMATAVRSVLEGTVAEFPTRNALRCSEQEIQWTYTQLMDHVLAVGTGLLEAGVKRGETVASILPSSAELVTLQLGAGAAGVRIASACVGSKAGEVVTKKGIETLLSEQKPRILVVSPDQLAAVYEAIPELKLIASKSSKPLRLSQYPFLKYVLQTGSGAANGTYRFRDILVYNSVEEKLGAPEDKDSAFLALVDAATGKVTGEQSVLQALEAGKKKAEELKLNVDSNVLFKANKDVGSKLCLGSLACLISASHLVIPSMRFSDEACKDAKEKDNCDKEIA